jgi:hypothetical protein
MSVVVVSCNKADDIEPISYLDQWTGNYEGTSHHWSSYPGAGYQEWHDNHFYKKVRVNVSKSSQDSCLDLRITYNDSVIVTREDLKFSKEEEYNIGTTLDNTLP